MFARKKLCFALLASLGLPVWALLPQEPTESGTTLLGGRLPWGASALPSGEVLAPCEDKTLSVLDDGAHVLARWASPERFSGPVTVAPRSSYQLLAAPLLSGAVTLLAWDPRTRVLAPAYTISHSAPVAATAWGVAGDVFVGWKDGRVEAWAPDGSLRWKVDSGLAVQSLLVDEATGIFVLGSGGVRLFGPHGQPLGSWALGGSPRGAVQSLRGELYTWTDQGLWVKHDDPHGFEKLDPSGQILGVVLDRLGSLVVTEPTRLRRMTAAGVTVSTVSLPRAAVTPSVLDDRGRIVVGTTSGVETWTYDGRLLGSTGTSIPSEFLITDRGNLVWSDASWTLHVWKGLLCPPLSWPETGGSPGRMFANHRPGSVNVRADSWGDTPGFEYFYQLAASGEEAKQRQVLERFEAEAVQGKLLDTWPFANVVLLKIGRSGLTDLQISQGRIVNNWPNLRVRSFALLAETAGPEDRDELLDLLQREYDPSVATMGVRALAQSGWDGDGKILRLLADLPGRMNNDPTLGDAIVDAARAIWATNGQSTDPALLPLVSALYQGPYPRVLKQKAQKLFQDLVAGP